MLLINKMSEIAQVEQKNRSRAFGWQGILSDMSLNNSFFWRHVLDVWVTELW